MSFSHRRLTIASGASKAIPWVADSVAAVGRRATQLAGWLYLALGLFITADVITRYLGFSTRIVDEVSVYVLALGTAWSMAFAFVEKDHVRVEVVLVKLPKVVQGYFNVVSLTVLGILLVLLVPSMWGLAVDAFEHDSRSVTALHLPLVWPESAWALGYTTFLLLIGITWLRAVHSLIRGKAAELATTLGPRSADEALEEGVVLE